MGIRKHKVKEAEVRGLTQTFILKSLHTQDRHVGMENPAIRAGDPVFHIPLPIGSDCTLPVLKNEPRS